MANNVDPALAQTWFKTFPRDFLRWLADNLSGIQKLDNQFIVGTGVPNGTVLGSPGMVYFNSAGGAGTTFYVKESGINTNVGWVGK